MRWCIRLLIKKVREAYWNLTLEKDTLKEIFPPVRLSG